MVQWGGLGAKLFMFLLICSLSVLGWPLTSRRGQVVAQGVVGVEGESMFGVVLGVGCLSLRSQAGAVESAEEILCPFSWVSWLSAPLSG